MKKQENMVANEDVLFGSAYGKLEAVRYPQQMPSFVFKTKEEIQAYLFSRFFASSVIGESTVLGAVSRVFLLNGSWSSKP